MNALKNFSNLAEIERRTFYYLCGFSFFLPISKAAGNIFLALSILGMIHRLYRKHDDAKFIFVEYKKIFATIAALFAAVLISALSSADILFGLKSFAHKYIGHVAIMFPVILICRDKEKILNLLKLLLAGIFISNFIVIVQGILNFNNSWRFGGTLMTMTQGTLIAMILPVYAVLIMHVQKKSWRIALIIAAAVAFLALLLNGTRGVWVIIPILVPAAVLIYAKNKLKAAAVLLSIFFIIAGIFATTPNLSARFATITNLQMQSNSERLLMWQSALEMFEDNPILGVGYGQYKTAYQTKYISPLAKERNLEHAHSNIFQMLAACGIVGTATFIFMWGYFSYFSLRRWFKGRKIEWLLFFCVLWGLMLHGLTEFNFETAVPSKFFWYALSLCIAYSSISAQKFDGGRNNF